MIRKVLFTIYSILVVVCLFYGIPLTIINIGKERFVIYLIIAIVGIVGLLLLGLFVMIKKDLDKKKQINQEEKK